MSLASHLALTADGEVSQPRVPLQPLSLEATEVHSRSVALKWDPPSGNFGALTYYVHFRDEESTRYIFIVQDFCVAFFSFFWFEKGRI